MRTQFSGLRAGRAEALSNAVEDLDMESSVLEFIFLVGRSWNIRRLTQARHHRVTAWTQSEEDYLLQLSEKGPSYSGMESD